MLIKTLLLLALGAFVLSFELSEIHNLEVQPFTANTYTLTEFYCGFGGDFCGQSTIDDVNSGASVVILAFGNTAPSGTVIIDDDNWPTAVVRQWRANGKKVLISVGGQNGNWGYVFASETSRLNFIQSLGEIVQKYSIDGVDLDIQSYFASPRVVAQTIIDLKTQLLRFGKKLLVVSPECVTVYQGSTVPDPDKGGQPFNYFVPIINLADAYIDFYQPQAYNNWYDGFAGGSLDYFRDVYLHWRNLKSLCQWCTPLPDFAGVAAKKLLIGILASTSAGSAGYYGSPQTIRAFKRWLDDNQYPLHGFMMWDSHWDTLNGKAISNACINP